MVEHNSAAMHPRLGVVDERRAAQRVASARQLFQRVLGAWASDCLELRRLGVIAHDKPMPLEDSRAAA